MSSRVPSILIVDDEIDEENIDWADLDNGVAAGITYLVRFASCVPLHATCAGAVALMMCRNQDFLGDFDWGDVGNFVLH